MPGKKKEEAISMEKKSSGRPKKSDAVVAEEIEVRKNVRSAARNTKEAVEDAAAQDATSDVAVAADIEVKKTVRKAGRKTKEAVDAVTAEVKRTARKASLDVIIESPLGGAISTDEIAMKIPKGCSAVYVRVDENKLYWVKGDNTGSVEIWE